MPIRYYPKSRVKINLSTTGGEFTQNGAPYSGKYHLTFDGKAFTGPDPITGPAAELERIDVYENAPGLYGQNLSQGTIRTLAQKARSQGKAQSSPISYYPSPIQSDYDRGYIIRYFTKRINERGYVIEISESEYNSIVNGTASYDVSMYDTASVFWKLTGPLNQKRISQFDVRAGIIDTNKRLVETASVKLVGLKEYINEKYDQFARPTE